MTTKNLFAVFGLFLVIAAVAGYVAWKNRQEPAQKTPATVSDAQKQQSWQNTHPGMSYEEFINLKGDPKKDETQNGTGTIYYAGINQYWDTAVTVQNNSVVFIREHAFAPQNVSLKSKIKTLASPPVRLYGGISESGQYLYVSPADGVAFIANDQNDTVYEVWYFKPASLSDILLLPAFRGYNSDPNKVIGGR